MTTEKTSHLPGRSGPAEPVTWQRERVEPLEPMPLRRGLCDWCGDKTKRGRSYCCPSCRVAYNNDLAKQGKTVMQLLKVWRLYRGGKGTPGEGKLTAVAARVDAFLAEDRERKAALAAARLAK